MLSLTERVTRHLILVTMPCGYAAEEMVGGLVEGLDRIPVHLLASITFDQGSEWANWATIAGHYGVDCWFCEPHSPWQRGQVENINRQWRWWFPRGTDLAGITPERADRAASIINGQRRRSLSYQSPTKIWADPTFDRSARPRCRTHRQIGLSALVAHRVMSSLLGSVLSITLRVVSTPATGRPAGSRRPSCTSTEAWSQ